MAKLKCPENCDSASFDGESFQADKNGFVEVPEEAVGALVDHGFKPATLAELNAKSAK
jgi:hypothetical protein